MEKQKIHLVKIKMPEPRTSIHICGLFEYIEYTFSVSWSSENAEIHSKTSLKHFRLFVFSFWLPFYQELLLPEWQYKQLHCASVLVVAQYLEKQIQNGIRTRERESEKCGRIKNKAWTMKQGLIKYSYTKSTRKLIGRSGGRLIIIHLFSHSTTKKKQLEGETKEKKKKRNQIQTQINKVGFVSLFLSLGRSLFARLHN